MAGAETGLLPLDTPARIGPRQGGRRRRPWPGARPGRAVGHLSAARGAARHRAIPRGGPGAAARPMVAPGAGPRRRPAGRRAA